MGGSACVFRQDCSMNPTPELEQNSVQEPQRLARMRDEASVLSFRRKVKFIDRLATGVISVSGLGIIAAVLGIGVFLFLEITPLFKPVHVGTPAEYALGGAGAPIRFVRVDEHQEHAAVIGSEPHVLLVDLANPDGEQRSVPLEGLENQRVSAIGENPSGTQVAVGTEDGLVWVGDIGFKTAFDGSKRGVQPVITPQQTIVLGSGAAVRAVAFRSLESREVLAAITDGGVVASRTMVKRPLVGEPRRERQDFNLPVDRFGQPIAVLVSEDTQQIVIGTDGGTLLRWRVPDDGLPELVEQILAVRDGAISAVAYLLGGRSIVVGGGDGSVATWSLVRDEESADGWGLQKIHVFASHPQAITVVSTSPRDKGFIAASAGGLMRLYYMTSERTLAEFHVSGRPAAGEYAPKTNGLLLANDNRLSHWQINNPHPEVSLGTLFGKVWYEGYPKPDYIWQSSGGTDDFEAKFSLVPLVFGTLKGTFYALLFAIPLALLGALYCSQFLEKRLRSRVKSTVELMAALPSVVLGFIAGVVLAPLAQRHAVTVLIMPVVLPLVTMIGMLLCGAVARRTGQGFLKRNEFWLLMGWVVAGAFVAGVLGPVVEKLVFSGNFEAWLLAKTGTQYDQRNSLVVGWTMGFAVVPIIFTICEDAFSSVPKHLTGASLACGASLWQTAWRVVLPAAGSGVFSAIMIGFGRAVGETMIVLMATGNTPVMDWSIFNGFRALSANIAVEIPEAPHGATLYRILFVAALLLFSMTSLVNTVAEVIRLRLRRQLQGL